MKLLPRNIGILAFLGPFMKHKEMCDRIGVRSAPVKTLEDLDSVDALIIPGTEIASLHFALKDLLPAIKERIDDGMPILLTGEACVLLSEDEKTEISQRKMKIEKFQKNNEKRFEEDLLLEFSDAKHFPGIFLRSPKIKKLGKNFRIISEKTSDGEDPVMIEKENILACSFYPEFTKDQRIHEYFLTRI